MCIRDSARPHGLGAATQHRTEKSGTARSERIDVIVPVYRGYGETLACLDSVMATAGADADIVVIDDATPETDLAAALRELAREGRVTLLRNRRNLGFPAAANRGLKLHPDRDAVILNADAQVFDGWLERLRRVAYAAADIGTVTPLSNAGSLASYPADESTHPSPAQAADLARLTAAVNQDSSIELPTGVGFCLYMRRECLLEIGDFDAATFDKGYGEENDFCLRASAAGWRHLLAAEVFVLHHGSRSFGARREALTERGLRLLDLRYPEYRPSVEAFLAKDPAHHIRRRLDEELLVSKTGRCVLLVTHALPGGVERHVKDRTEELKTLGLEVLLLRPVDVDGNACVLAADDPELQDLRYDAPEELPLLGALLARLLIDHVEIHHTLNLDPGAIEMVIALGRPYDVIIHDFAFVCPRIMFSGADGQYCGMPEISECIACIETHGSLLGEPIGVAALRQRSARWLGSARSILAPSRDAAVRLERYLPGLPVTIQPWQVVSGEQPKREVRRAAPLRVAIIGAIGERKGYGLVRDCARDALARDLPLEFTIIGYTMNDQPLMDAGKVFITGEYDEAEIDALIRREDPDLAFLPYITPETWCYTLTHALRAGLPVVAFDIGAVAERLRGSPAMYRLLPLGTDAAALNDQLIQYQADLAAIYDARIAIEQTAVPQSLPTGSEIAFSGDAVILEDIVNIHRFIAVQTPPQPVALTASVEALALEQGLYLFAVRRAAPTRIGGEQGVVLPALHVGPAPGVPAGHVSMLTSPGTSGAWLYHPNDVFVVRVAAAAATVLVTSLRAEKMAPLEIEVRRLDAPNGVSAAVLQHSEAPPNPAPPPQLYGANPAAKGGEAGETHGVRVQIVAHVQNRGDLLFTGPGWAGCVGQRLAIEAFSIHPLDRLTAEQIEYKAYTATGIETAWVSGGALCGTRGIAVPLVGFAVRLKDASDAMQYECSYSGSFTSGRRTGPFTNGAPCQAPAPDDRLEAIQLSLTARVPMPAVIAAAEAAPGIASPPEEKPTSRRVIRPRFSALRDPPAP